MAHHFAITVLYSNDIYNELDILVGKCKMRAHFEYVTDVTTVSTTQSHVSAMNN